MSSPLNGYLLANQFRKVRHRYQLTSLDADLFYELVAVCNDEGWPEVFQLSNPRLFGSVGCTEKGMMKPRERLKTAGLLAFVPGTNRNPSHYSFTLSQDLLEVRVKGEKPAAEYLPEFSDSSANEAEHLPRHLPEFSITGENDSKHLPEHLPKHLPEVSPLYKEKEKENIGAALAASLPASLPAENSAPPSAASSPKPTAKKTRKAETAHAEIAALPLPHPGPDFATIWRTFYTQNTKQAGKPLSAFELMLKKLGKYPEGFAVEMLEAAIQGNWSGVENGGTAQRYIDWQQRLRANTPGAGASPAPTARASDLNHEFIAEQESAAAAQRAARFDQYATAAA